jgi:hypothetical protein
MPRRAAPPLTSWIPEPTIILFAALLHLAAGRAVARGGIMIKDRILLCAVLHRSAFVAGIYGAASQAMANPLCFLGVLGEALKGPRTGLPVAAFRLDL